ncbi:site-2 protease family protein [Alicyclobacillus fodiniaquatilis]|uniref:Site-2 protease family protein n=1 Tax=Alicyclobacillus fodiniaquatilis TaxID=1661150 RepID=A0ABW4JGS2_9BACL
MLGFLTPSYILTIFVVLFSLVVHEYAHALAADLQGDKTARLNGRLTVNPLAHLDFLGIIMILLVGIGWAQPVPINMNNFRRPRLSFIISVAAGPASNFILAVLSYFALSFVSYSSPMLNLLSIIGGVNVSLFLLNIIPLPPLDGSQILRHLLPYRQALAYSKLDTYGPFILLLLFIVPQFRNLIFGDVAQALSSWIWSWFG